MATPEADGEWCDAVEGEISSPKALRESPRENRENSDQVVFVDAPSDSVGALGEVVVR